ncbi:hypothetical protein SAMN05216428_102327 [Nitrosospira sp. Nsp11]|uniref:hypothetical protein n=1 Tax=Nitrosospira sp. Nsp11 TaxID=1855338 RepID=UPI00091A2A89|nr:hypothetical protein [Nitrosospira sp. Nsp11]SHL41406.1 hypothetical protein SAMN05216428_102327 [Nitrosospira sp. Nsp11]
METEKEKKMKKAVAVVGFLPVGSGDGYGYGGGAVLTIGDKSIHFGESYESSKLAEEVARRWNAGSSSEPAQS